MEPENPIAKMVKYFIMANINIIKEMEKGYWHDNGRTLFDGNFKDGIFYGKGSYHPYKDKYIIWEGEWEIVNSEVL